MLPVILRFAPFYGHSVCGISHKRKQFLITGSLEKETKIHCPSWAKLNVSARETSNKPLLYCFLSGKIEVGSVETKIMLLNSCGLGSTSEPSTERDSQRKSLEKMFCFIILFCKSLIIF